MASAWRVVRGNGIGATHPSPSLAGGARYDNERNDLSLRRGPIPEGAARAAGNVQNRQHPAWDLHATHYPITDRASFRRRQLASLWSGLKDADGVTIGLQGSDTAAFGNTSAAVRTADMSWSDWR